MNNNEIITKLIRTEIPRYLNPRLVFHGTSLYASQSMQQGGFAVEAGYATLTTNINTAISYANRDDEPAIVVLKPKYINKRIFPSVTLDIDSINKTIDGYLHGWIRGDLAAQGLEGQTKVDFSKSEILSTIVPSDGRFDYYVGGDIQEYIHRLKINLDLNELQYLASTIIFDYYLQLIRKTIVSVAFHQGWNILNVGDRAIEKVRTSELKFQLSFPDNRILGQSTNDLADLFEINYIKSLVHGLNNIDFEDKTLLELVNLVNGLQII